MAKRICFTGHRTIPGKSYYKLNAILIRRIEQVVERGYTVFNTGGAMGFDTMAALAVLRVKRKYPQVQLHLYLPYKGQADMWSARQQDIYYKIKAQADKITYATEEYTPYCMSMRNRALVDNRNGCIAFCQRATGGTAYTLNYAIDKGMKFINIANDL